MAVEPFTYRDDGAREPFDPERAGERLAGCLLCGRRIVCIALFEPHDDTTRDAVLKLRQQPLRAFSTPALVYGLCAAHISDVIDKRTRTHVVARIEDLIIALAARVRLH